MSDLGNPRVIQQLMKEHHISARKKYGQNFLIDANILRQIVEAAEIYKEDLVLEIGPGFGALTEQLLKAAGKVIAVEVDQVLIPILQENLKDYSNLVLLNKDILAKLIMKQLRHSRQNFQFLLLETVMLLTKKVLQK